tara:strand:- start:734 stop:919 length:186 start_codon:yes stop_codon:yes gene_type:complete
MIWSFSVLFGDATWVSCQFQVLLKPSETIENQCVQKFWSNLRYRHFLHKTTILLQWRISSL